jgi:hypothetical protein
MLMLFITIIVVVVGFVITMITTEDNFKVALNLKI